MRAPALEVVNKRVGRILAGLEIGDRLTCMDFLRQQLGVEAYVEVRSRKDVLLNELAVELRKELEHAWYIESKRELDIEALMRVLQDKAYEAKRTQDIANHQLLNDIAEQAGFDIIIAARHREEHQAKEEEEVAAWRRERRARRDEAMEFNAMAYRRKRFEEYLKQMVKVYRGDGGYGLAMQATLMAGDLDGAKRIYRSIPEDIKADNPMLHTVLVVAEIFMAKPESDAKSFVLGVEVGTAFEYESPFTMKAPSPYAH